MEFPDTKIKYFFWIMIQMIDSVVGIKKEIKFENFLERVREPRMVSNRVWLYFESSLE